MRHRVAHRKLGRTMEHRRALRRNLAYSLFEHGQIRTTLEKAKDLQPYAERMITLAKKARGGDLNSRRRLHRLLSERFFVPREHQEDYENLTFAKRQSVKRFRSGRAHRTGEPKGALPFTTESVSHRLINDIAERFEDRQGGYTRIIQLSRVRIGDAGQQAIIQLVGEEETPTNVPKPRKSSRRRKADARYAAVLKAAKDRAPETRKKESESEPKSHTETESTAPEPKDSDEASQS